MKKSRPVTSTRHDEMHFYRLIHNFLTEYLIVRRNFSDKTAKSYRQTLKLLRNYMHEEKGIPFERMDFSSFSRNNIYEFLLWLKTARGNTPKTLNLRLSAIKSFLKYCGEEDLELMHVYLEVSGIHAFKGEKNPRIDYLTPAQLKHVFSLPDISTRLGRRNRFFMVLAYETGARLQELLDLTMSSIIRSDSNVRVRIHGKGSKIRYVPIFGSALKHLDAYLAEFHKYSPTDAFVFYTIHDAEQTQMKPGTVDYFLKQYAKAAQETDALFPANLHAHMFRHSIAMAMYKKGIPISYIRDFLGHSSIETTSIYSYADDETLLAALETVAHVENVPKQKNWKGNEQRLIEYCGLG